MLIAKSDAVILVVSASLLAAGIYRWQSNLSQSYETRSVASFPSAFQGSNSQRLNTGSLAAKPGMASGDHTRAAGTGVNASAETNFGNTVQSSTQNLTVTSNVTDKRSSPDNTTGQPLYGTYEVKSGDSLSKIAITYGTTVDTLRNINDISGSLIIVGQNIRYPLPAN